MKITFDYELKMGDGGDAIFETLECSAFYTAYCDNSYGADADGNRGVRMVTIEDLKVRILNSRGEDITKVVEKGYPVDFQKIMDEASDQAYWVEDLESYC